MVYFFTTIKRASARSGKSGKSGANEEKLKMLCSQHIVFQKKLRYNHAQQVRQNLYKKVHIFATLFLRYSSFIDARPIPEGGQRHAALLCGGGAGDLVRPPPLVGAVEVLRQGLGRPSEAHPSGFGGGNALGLALADVHPLIFRHKGEDLEDDIT